MKNRRRRESAAIRRQVPGGSRKSVEAAYDRILRRKKK